MASAPTTGVDTSERTGPLTGLNVIDLSTTAPGALATQFLVEAGAEVILVERPGGSPLRRLVAWPVLGGGKRSIVLDLHDAADREVFSSLLIRADVLVTTMRPKTLAKLGLEASRLAELNPRLVSAAITGWGSTGPWKDYPGYEALVMAKLGMNHVKSGMVERPGPAFVSTPYATWGAAQSAVHGILAALFERESSGRGQHVEADLVRGVGTIDTWQWFAELVSIRWPGAYQSIDAYDENGEPLSPITFPLLRAPTKDGVWLQFAQTEPRLFVAMLQEFGLAHLLSDPEWKGIPRLESQEKRSRLWEMMIKKVGERTLAEWQQVFDTNPNVSAEVFRTCSEALDHPQIQYEGRAVIVEDPQFGPVRRPSAMVFENGKPISDPRPAPRLDEHGVQLRRTAASATTSTPVTPTPEAPVRLPLAGVTILEFGSMFAGPFGSTLLTDLGARVIKVETLEGDTIRNILPFPESGGAKVMQGKESICLDLKTEEGKRIVYELVKRVDVVLQAFRAGGAERAGVDAATLKRINPTLIYVNAPGYGTDGPYGHRPAYAPSIGAALGFAHTDAPDAIFPTSEMSEIKAAARRLNKAVSIPTMQSDGVSALGVASTILLGLLARARGRALGPLTVTMLGTGTHALVDRVIDYPGRPASPTVDKGGYGFSALYRLYPAREGWICLAAPTEKDWSALVTALADEVDLGGDERFATEQSRAANDSALAELLGAVFARRPAAYWEKTLIAAGVGCVEATAMEPARYLQTDPVLAATYAVTATSPIFEEHLRPAPHVSFSRSVTQAKGGCRAGEHTDSILREIGYDDATITELHQRGIVAG